MEFFAVKADGQHCYQVIENESMHIVGYLEQGEKGFYIRLMDEELLWEIIRKPFITKNIA